MAHENYFSTAAMWLLAVLGQACVSWPIRVDTFLGIQGGALETRAKREHFSQRGNTELQHWTVWGTEVFYEHKIMKLKITIICFLERLHFSKFTSFPDINETIWIILILAFTCLVIKSTLWMITDQKSHCVMIVSQVDWQRWSTQTLYRPSSWLLDPSSSWALVIRSFPSLSLAPLPFFNKLCSVFDKWLL